jgi:hypothetical protein
MTTPSSGPLSLISSLRLGLLGPGANSPCYACECSAERADNCITLLHGPVDLLSVGVQPAGGAPCCFQRSASTYDLTERALDAKRQRVFWCWQIQDGKPAAACERLAQPIYRPFSHAGRSLVAVGCVRSRERARGDLGRYLLGV